MMEQYLLQLMLSTGIGNVALKRILERASVCSFDYLKYVCDNPEKLSSIIKLRKDTVASVRQNEEYAKILLQKLIERNVVVITELDSLYPQSLKNSLGKDCPAVLFAQGNTSLLNSISVGFCGSRKVSTKGSSITEQCAKQLVEQGVTVVSGYASGTDLYAHTSALSNG